MPLYRKPELLNVEYPGKLTLLVTRVSGGNINIKTAKCPSTEMRNESKYEVWLYPV